ncbi:outer membrane receptor for ferric coprogen and ferric-rhodotorulic acid [Azonexus fungiphilus]|uniref:Outer membrane receptor for ferric coprogen and ferric-rhodotorulic acid n=1 Tax=Azonexus fungiphilus TaxID=146940 RepID=A0A495VM60_9RHOO|nr:TonB-dependent receptor [Azonexus fungiphilus]RKT49657.1 outer membrane receptor for ferric coprogen and ferric-rhodotorulic acid [Azonexus fungiphilus]
MHQHAHQPPFQRQLCTLLCLAGLAGQVPIAIAAEPPAATSAARAVDIGPGPLSEVLARYAASAGVALSFDAASLRQIQSPGLKGSYGVQQGFDRLLAGSGMEAVQTSSGNFALRRLVVHGSGEATLPAVTVNASGPRSTTENSGSYASGGASVFKGVEKIREIPQPVTVMTRQLIDDRALLDLHDVLQNTTGIAVDYVDSERVTYYSRGFQLDAIQVDGLTFNPGGSAFIQPDTAVLDRVEVLRGASGMIRGTGNPSGAMNLVRKRPTKDSQASARLTLGSWDRRRLEADLSTPLNEAGTLRSRFVAVKDKKGFFQDVKQEDREVFYGVIEADLGPRTTLTASLQHADLKATGSWGNLPRNFDGSSLDLPRSTFLGADWNKWNRENQQAYVELQHQFDNEWTLKLNTAYARLKLNDFKQSYFTRNSTTNPYQFSVTTAEYVGAQSDQLAAGLTANGPFELLGRKHGLVVGLEKLRIKSRDSWGRGSLFPVTVDIRDFDPRSSYPEQAVDLSGIAPSKPVYTTQTAAFATTRLSLTDRLSALLGARANWYEYDSHVPPANASVVTHYKINREVTPYAGLVYDLTPQLSAYASYTEIFQPQNVLDASGNMLAPITGEDYEIGFKGEFLNGRLNATLGMFRIDNNGKAVEDTASTTPCPPSNLTGYCRVAGGEQRSEGWELELSGEIQPKWQVFAGYTNTRTKYLRDTAANTGQPLRSIDPKHQLRLFTTYNLSSWLPGLTVGGGAQIQSDAYARSGSVVARQSGYAIYNAMLAYRFAKAYSLQLNVNNLFDKVYYKKFAPTGISNYYGDPRNLMLTFRADL